MKYSRRRKDTEILGPLFLHLASKVLRQNGIKETKRSRTVDYYIPEDFYSEISEAKELEIKFAEMFKDEAGKDLCYFNYIFLDSHILQLKYEGKDFDFSTFLKAVFYIGMGSKDWPYTHLNYSFAEKDEEGKRIEQICDGKRGVVHIFFTGKSKEEADGRAKLMTSVRPGVVN